MATSFAANATTATIAAGAPILGLVYFAWQFITLSGAGTAVAIAVAMRDALVSSFVVSKLE